MLCRLTKKEELSTNAWSGGKTTQLFLYPPESSYVNRDFLVRISSADVEEDSSVFTVLPGFHRILMPLDSEMRLVYEGHGEVAMQPFQAAEFDGGWNTTSYGKCTDIGIMLAAGWQGELRSEMGEYALRPGFTGVYALTDGVSVRVQNGEKSIENILMQGDFLLLELNEDATLTVKAEIRNGAVVASAYLIH